MANHDVIIVGTGITGASTAYHLKKRGVGRVLLLERQVPAAGGTGRSAAIVRQHYSTRLMTRLAHAAVGMFQSMKDDLGQDGGYRRVGYAFLTPADAIEASRRNVDLQRQVGVETRFLEQDEIAARMPWLNTEGVAGVIWEAQGGYADPVRTTEAYVEAFRKLGGEVRLKTACRGLVRRGDRIEGVVADEGEIAAGMVVNAAGPWAPKLADLAGIELTMRTLREQDTVWQWRPNRPMPECAISDAVDAIYLRPVGEGRVVLGRGFPKPYVDCDPENYKQTADEPFIAEVRERAELRFPSFQGAALVDSYSALYDVTPDWYPFIGPRAGLAGYCDASGGSGHGFKIAPAIGRELAGWIVDGHAAADFARLSYDRIARKELFQQAYGGNRG
jgi:glycine/D-amino acid oxidase-like deaminating enzyme